MKIEISKAPSLLNRELPDPGPPRLLLGATMLFWGGISGRPLIGLCLALVVEAAHWTRVRWDFTDLAFYRAWQASLILLLVAGILNWMDGSRLSVVTLTLAWLPVLFLPLQFVQSYGMRRTMPLATLSLFVRKRRDHALRHGLPFRDVHFPFGHAHFALTLIAASLCKNANSPVFFPGVAILTAWAFHKQFSRSPRLAPAAALAILAGSVAGGYGGERAFDLLYRRLDSRGHRDGPADYSRQSRTSIGDLGEIKRSPNIQWRVSPIDGPLPRLLRLASYNSYRNAFWRVDAPSEPDSFSGDFVSLTTVGIDSPLFITARRTTGDFLPRELSTADTLPRFRLRGSLPQKTLLPIPGNAASLSVPAQDIEINSFGALRIDPRHPVADATILWSHRLFTELPPWESEDPRFNPGRDPRIPDLRIPESEQEVIRTVATGLGLHEGTLGQKINRIRSHFNKNFTYSLYQEKRRPEGRDGPANFIGDFLTETRRGHCEYFATATTFLLREAGIPTRYATGFAVAEINPTSGEALLRGTHAHAWSRAWDEASQTWIDVDLTPPDWLGLETPKTPPWQDLLDRWQMLREDLTVWRSQPGNLALTAFIIAIPLSLGGLLVGRRLWKSRRRIDPVAARRNVRPKHATTPLLELEKPASRLLGARPPGMPLGPWLRQLAPSLPDPASLDQAIQLHRTLRFDPSPPDPSAVARLAALVSRLRQELTTLPATLARPGHP